MYKNVCHKIIIYVLVGCLSFCVPATTYYKSVHAIEYLGGALAFEEALKWLLALVGVTAVGSAASQVDWQDVREQCVEVQLHNGASQAQVSAWWAKLAKGTLDKASSCWSSFKEWAQSLTESQSGGSIDVSLVLPTNCTITQFFNVYNSQYGKSYSCSSGDVVFDNFIMLLDSNNNITYVHFFVGGTYSCSVANNGCTFYFSNAKEYYSNSVSGNSIYLSQSGFHSSNTWLNFSSLCLVTSGWFDNVSSLGSNNWIIASSNSTSSNFDWQSAIDVAKQNLQVLNRDLPDENANEVAIPMPGLADSDDEASADAYDNIIDAINDGTITLDDGIAQIQDLLHVLVIDDTTDIVQPVRPDPDTGEDQTKEDVVKENKSNMGFTLAGLEKVFPFCIPFDIYAFMTLLVADPVAPEFDFPIKSVNNQTEEIHIDLSPFEPVAVVVRYIFDFLFIIGLALMTRSLIGGGSSD